jgi:hypothetical protein
MMAGGADDAVTGLKLLYIAAANQAATIVAAQAVGDAQDHSAG